MWSAEGQVMLGKTVIITGANTGIGFETAAELARYGAKVVMASRDKAKTEKAKQLIVERLRGQDGQADIEDRLIVDELDLGDFDSVRAFADRMSTLPRLDVLINNAGVMLVGDKQVNKDGLELCMATNHFGHFLLTNLLLPLLKKSAPSRIVNVSSRAHRGCKIDFDNLNYEKYYERTKVYGTSKLANILFTRELTRRLQGTGVIANSLHPGVVITELGRNLPGWLMSILGGTMFFWKLLLKNPLEGAQTSIYLAAAQTPDVLESGRYFADCRVTEPTAAAQDDEAASKLWEVSEKITKLS